MEQRRGDKPLVHRQRRAIQEEARDREMLGWIARFRLVGSEELGMRFEITPQRVNARVRRLLGARLLGQMRIHRNERRLVYVTGRGARRLGLPVRRPPQPDFDIHTEGLLARLTAILETRDRHRGSPVLTSREARSIERATGRPHSVASRNKERWPDLILTDGLRLVALVVELYSKPKKKLEECVRDYKWSETFDEVIWLTAGAAAQDRLQKLISSTSPSWRTNEPGMRVLTYDWQLEGQLATELVSTTASSLAVYIDDADPGAEGFDWDAVLMAE